MSAINGAMMPAGGAGPGPGADGPQMTGKSTDGDFEKSFSDIAFAYVQDKTPQLNKFLVGFQILDRDEEGYRAAGVFGYKINNRELFIPVFFLKGELKGLDLIYVKDRDIFVPLQENWVNYLINKKNVILGSGAERDNSHFGPDLSVFFRSPAKNYKLASETGNLLSLRDSQKPYNNELDLSILTKTAGKTIFVKFCKALLAKPELAEAVGKFYAPEQIVKIASDSKELVYTRSPDVTIISSSEDPRAIFLDDKQLEKLARRQNVYIDKRAASYTSEVILDDPVESSLQNPDYPGLYSCLTEDGEFRDVFACKIFLDRKQFRSKDNPYNGHKLRDLALVVDLKDKTAFFSLNKALWVKNDSDPSEFAKWFKKQDNVSSIKVQADNYLALPSAVDENAYASRDQYYVIISPKGNCTLPFRVTKKIKSADGTTRLEAYWLTPYADRIQGDKEPVNFTGRQTLIPWMEQSEMDGSYGRSDCLSIVLTDSTSPNSTSVGQALVIPSTFKVLKVEYSYEQSHFNPGDIVDIHMHIKKMASEYFTPFDLYVDNGEFRISTPLGTSSPLYGEQFVRDLVVKHGLTEKAARDLSGILVKKGSLKAFIKYAAHYPTVKSAQLPFLTNSGMSIPTAPLDSYTFNHMRGYREDYGNLHQLPIFNPDVNSRLTNLQGMGDGDEQLIMQAANSGQKQLMDTAILGAMVRSFNSQELVDKFLPDLTNALDRIGRILFFFYWHNDDFIERYGSEEIPELEDGLKNIFKGLGDLVLFLQQKTVVSPNFGELNLSDIQ